ncbi:envelope glycoprotein [Simian immunodeficiency virus]|uniref:Envelope glycoprotein gp160 n=1 Tax=Simian immunodeficiency virus TaxID=11723 RepID=Q9WPP0_SIV|nr:envelope glycoprotein [Simian immunodeficiency virus]
MRCPEILIGFSLLLGSIAIQYVTVFYGTPKWEPAVVPLICASANNSLWVTTSCLPDLQTYAEVPITGLEENFTEGISNNQIVQQAWQAMTSMVDAIMKPCVKINPYCVKMKCPPKPTTPSSNSTVKSSCDYWTTTTAKTTTQTTSSTSSTASTTTPMPLDWNCTDTENIAESNKVCKYNVTGLCRDCKTEVEQNFRDTEVTCNGNDTCYMTHCNDSIITQDCHKGIMQNAYFRLCAPAGYMLLRCDEKLNATKKCKNITATPCTNYMTSTVSSFFGFNGTRHKEDELIPINNKVGQGAEGEYVWKVAAKWGLVIQCIRKGNRSQVSTISSTGLLFYYGLEPGSKLRLAQCKFVGQWGRAFATLGKLLRQVEPLANMSNGCTFDNITKTCRFTNGTDFKKMIKFKPMEKHGADAATEMLMMTCGEEMFFCNLTRIFKVWNDTTSNKWYPWANCHIKSVIDDWASVGKKIYLPPTSGFNNRIRCANRVTEAWFTLERVEDWKVNGSNISVVAFQPPTNTLNQFVSTGAHYKLVRIRPIGFAPTDEHRYAPRKEKRAAPVALGALALLSAAGTAMGLVSTILTVQAQAVLQGILQQQKQLLVLVEKQQELLRLTIWGVKNLQARLTALEEYVQDQSLLASWGCQWKQVCHTNVPWNYNITPNWTKDTWMEWDRQVKMYDDNITALLQEAYVTELENQNKFKQLQEFNFWSWLDLSQWFLYIKYAVLIIGIIIAARILSFIIQQIYRMCQGYRVLSPSAYVEQDWLQETCPKPTDKEEEEETEKERIYINLEQSKKESLPPPWTVDWDEPLRDSLLVTLLKWLKAWGIVLAQNIYHLLSFLWHLLTTSFHHGQRLWQTLRGWLGSHLIQATSRIRNACRTSRERVSSSQKARSRTFSLGRKWRPKWNRTRGSRIPSETTETTL